MAHLKTKATTGKLPEREQWKWRLIRGLYEKEFAREQIIKLFEIIDNMMTLSSELQSSLESKIKQFEEERTMPLVSNMELRGIERGKEIGKEIGFFVTWYGSIGGINRLNPYLAIDLID